MLAIVPLEPLLPMESESRSSVPTTMPLVPEPDTPPCRSDVPCTCPPLVIWSWVSPS